ncbi:hypothetical protein L1049_019284 [Liquidambar formosana]|uniref:Uncharacterized protein n=1 Tax=Liquidambar formosana TaxID=63359 RepID=A0AAP0X2Y6_LIQFO
MGCNRMKVVQRELFADELRSSRYDLDGICNEGKLMADVCEVDSGKFFVSHNEFSDSRSDAESDDSSEVGSEYISDSNGAVVEDSFDGLGISLSKMRLRLLFRIMRKNGSIIILAAFPSCCTQVRWGLLGL